MQIDEISTIVSLARHRTKHMMMKYMGYSISLQRFSFNFHLRFVCCSLLDARSICVVLALLLLLQLLLFHIKMAK